MIGLLVTLAAGGVLLQEVSACDYATQTNVPHDCPLGAQQQAYAIDVHMTWVSVPPPTSVGQALERAALHWSNLTGSSVEGAFGWSVQRGADLTVSLPEDVFCDQTNNLIVLPPALYEVTCPAAAQGLPLPIACVKVYGDQAADPCDIVEADIFLPDDVIWAEVLPSEVTSTSALSLEQVLAHELGHVFGFDHDSEWPAANKLRLMDASYPHGGDHGAGPASEVRISTGEFYAMSLLRPESRLGGVHNPMLTRFRPHNADHSIEMWTPTTASYEGQTWSQEVCGLLAWNADWDLERPWYPIRLVSHDMSPQDIEVDWYLSESADPADCGDLDLWLGSESYDTVTANVIVEIGKSAVFFVPPTATPGSSYHVCAQLTASSNDETVDDVVVSEQLFTVTAPEEGDELCACDGTLACPTGLTCQVCPSWEPWCSATGYGCQL